MSQHHHPVLPSEPGIVSGPGDLTSLTDQANELERQADEQMFFHHSTANGYMQRLHRELAESLRLEASIIRSQRDAMERI
jgi:hypothetical protein